MGKFFKVLTSLVMFSLLELSSYVSQNELYFKWITFLIVKVENIFLEDIEYLIQIKIVFYFKCV